MLLSITGRHRILLARGAAVLMVAGLAAGCSTGAASLSDGLVTNSTTPVAMAQADQPYPGEAQGGRRARQSYDRVMRPKEPVGQGILQSNTQTTPPPAAAPVYSAPVYSATTSNVSSTPLPAPTVTQRSALAPVAASPSASAPAPKPAKQAAVVPKPQQAPQAQAAAPQKAPSTGGAYTVAAGDTLYAISRKTGVGVDAIKQANGLSDGSIRIGQKLSIPGGSVVAAATPVPAKVPDPIKTSTTVAAKTPAAKEEEAPKVTAYTPPAKEKLVEDAASDTQVAALTPDSTGVGRLRWPARGRVVAGFGSSSGKASDGIDIAVPEGTSVHSAENGVVIYAGDGLKGFGNTVLVRHEDGLVTVYGHASDLKVKRGDKVRRGQEIALSGMTGDADRPKLHFEVRKGTNPVDPMTYLE